MLLTQRFSEKKDLYFLGEEVSFCLIKTLKIADVLLKNIQIPLIFIKFIGLRIHWVKIIRFCGFVVAVYLVTCAGATIL